MLKVLQHPLITHKLTQMRKKETGTKDFRQNLDEIAGLMAYEISRDFPLQPVEINTPVAKTTTYELAKEIVLVPILRAGLGMVNGICDLIPTVKIAHVGLYRDEETLEPHTYFEKYPKEVKDAIVMIVDPMLATGGSAIAAIDMVKKQGAKNIRLVCLVGAPEGVRAVEEAHPEVDIYLAALDVKTECKKGISYPDLEMQETVFSVRSSHEGSVSGYAADVYHGTCLWGSGMDRCLAG